MHTIRNFENINEECLQGDAYEVGFQHVTDNSVNAAIKQKGEEEQGEEKSETCTIMSSSSQKQAFITKYFSKYQLCKNVKQSVKLCE
jgi:hypothetical protein